MKPEYDTGKTRKWKYGEPCDYRRGVPFHSLKGPCPQCGRPTFDYGGGWRCQDGWCLFSYTNPAPNFGPEPAWWLDGTKVYLDGNAWCATRADFVNLQESPAGFGSSPREAVAALAKELEATRDA